MDESKYISYPRTHHAIFSPGATDDDKTLSDYSDFEDCDDVIASIKMDGECTTMYNDYIHARSIFSKNQNHPSRDFVKGIWGNIMYEIPEGWRICGENLYAKHSIEYNNLESYFYCFNIWNQDNVCLSYDETLEWCSLFNLVHVPVIYRGKFDLKHITDLFETMDKNIHEGIVIRKANQFHYDDFSKNVFKAVRENHVQTSSHWMYDKITPNQLKK